VRRALSKHDGRIHAFRRETNSKVGAGFVACLWFERPTTSLTGTRHVSSGQYPAVVDNLDLACWAGRHTGPQTKGGGIAYA
jgi:hypothetical protein